MTNKSTGVTDETRPIRPVTYRENAEVDGLALCADFIFERKIEAARQLRERQAAYRANLPTDAGDALKAALRIIHPCGNNYPEGFEEALHLSFALEAMAMQPDIDADGPTREAFLYVAARVTSGLMCAAQQIEEVGQILANPRRHAG